ncbi:hypothetical protein [Prevotella jejuni]
MAIGMGNCRYLINGVVGIADGDVLTPCMLNGLSVPAFSIGIALCRVA